MLALNEIKLKQIHFYQEIVEDDQQEVEQVFTPSLNSTTPWGSRWD
jgi:hypothetical protein